MSVSSSMLFDAATRERERGDDLPVLWLVGPVLGGPREGHDTSYAGGHVPR